jgi:hypothetical protein
MNKSQNIFKKLQQWYRHLFIDLPEGYGDPISPDVERFDAELNENIEMSIPVLDGREPHNAGHGDSSK